MSQPSNINSLFQAAQAENLVTAAGAAVVLNIPDMGAAIQAGLGVKVDDVQASEVLLVTFLVDDSGSICSAGNEGVVRDGVNLVLEALKKSKQRDSILVSCLGLNRGTIYPYALLDNVPNLDTNNYRADGGTPLYDMSAVVLGQVLAKTQEFSDAGVPTKTVTVIVTDGADVHSTIHRSPDAVAPLVKDLRRQENHIIAAMGIADGSTDFTSVFTRMGIDPRWILLPSNTQSEIRKAFALVSQSAVRASQAVAAFSRVAAGGFGTP